MQFWRGLRGACRDTSADLQARETQSIPLVRVAPMTVEIDRRDLPNRVKASFTPVGNSADSPEPPLRPLPATGHAAEILDV